jgi:hypothetical protein
LPVARHAPPSRGGEPAVAAVPLLTRPAVPLFRSPLLWVGVGGGAVLLLAVILIVAFAFRGAGPTPEQTGQPTRKTLDLTYVSKDFGAALVIDTHRLAKTEILDHALVKALLKEPRKLGLDPKKMERVLVLLGPDPSTPAGLIFRFTEATDFRARFKKKEVEELTHEGKKYLKLKLPTSPYDAACVPDDRTVLLSAEETLKAMLTAKDETSPLITRLRKLDLDNDVISVVALEPYRDQAREKLNAVNWDKLPPQFEDVKKLPDQLEAVTLTLNLADDRFLALDLEAKDAKASKEVFKLAEEIQTWVKANYQQVLRQELRKAEPGLATPITETAKGFVEGIELRHEAPRVVVRFRKPSSLAELATKLAPLMAKGMQGP